MAKEIKTEETKAVKKEIRDPNDLVEVMIPSSPDDERNYEWVCVNGHSLSIPKDEYVQIPRKYAEVIQNKQRMEKINREITNSGAKNLGDF